MKTNEDLVAKWLSEFKTRLAITEKGVTDYIQVLTDMLDKRTGTEEATQLTIVIVGLGIIAILGIALIVGFSLSIGTLFWYVMGNAVASAFHWPAVTVQQAFIITVLSALLSKSR